MHMEHMHTSTLPKIGSYLYCAIWHRAHNAYSWGPACVDLLVWKQALQHRACHSHICMMYGTSADLLPDIANGINIYLYTALA